MKNLESQSIGIYTAGMLRIWIFGYNKYERIQKWLLYQIQLEL